MKMSGEEIDPCAAAKPCGRRSTTSEVLAPVHPRLREHHREFPTPRLEAKVVVKIGPVKARFSGNVTLSDLDPPNGYRISGQGSGGLPAMPRAAPPCALRTVPEGTKLSYDVDAQVGGKIASLGARFIDPTARSLASQFFDKFAEIARHARNSYFPLPAVCSPSRVR